MVQNKMQRPRGRIESVSLDCETSTLFHWTLISTLCSSEMIVLCKITTIPHWYQIYPVTSAAFEPAPMIFAGLVLQANTEAIVALEHISIPGTAETLLLQLTLSRNRKAFVSV